MKNVIFYTAKNGKSYFKSWFFSLEKTLFNKVLSRLDRVRQNNLGDHKSLKCGLWELRFTNGLRVYYTEAENTFVVLFYGGNKTTQKKDIARARELLAEFTQREDLL